MTGAADPPARLALVVENGRARGRRVEIPAAGVLVAGRDRAADLPLPDALVSRRHFQVRRAGDTVFLEDLGSQNGTFLNDRLVREPARLHVGDVIRAGETLISLTRVGERGLVGRELGGYRILERVGRGGMGTVYRARQLSLQREVALKVLSPRLMEDPTFVELFFREARAAGAMNHPHIVQVYDVGESQGIYYLSMEFMAGGTVQDRLDREGKIPWREAAAMVRQAALGLAYARHKGIVHRDIKPDNLMLTEDGRVKIADLGLAHPAGEGAGPGGILGTPHFIAPEQAQGRPVDVRTDLYALGATLFRMVTGRNVFPGRNAREILLAQIKETPPLAHEVEPSVPPALSQVIARLLKKDPGERYPDPETLVRDLDRLLSPPRKGQTLVLAGAAALLFLAVGAWLLWPRKPAPVPASSPPPPRAAAAPPPQAPPPPKGPAAPARADRETEAELAYRRIPPAGKLSPAERLRELRSVARRFPDTAFGRRAAREAEALERAARAKETALRRAREELARRWARVREEAARRAAAGAFGAAAARVEAFLAAHPPPGQVGGLDFRPEARALLGQLERRAQAAWQRIEAETRRRLEAGQYGEARRELEVFARTAAAAAPPGSLYGGLRLRALALLRAVDQAAAAARAARFRADRRRAIRALRQAREALQGADFAGATGLLREAAERMQTRAYRRWLEGAVERYQGLVDLKNAFLARVGAGQLADRRVPLPAPTLGQEEGTLLGADAEHLTVRVVIHGQPTVLRPQWSAYPPRRLVRLFRDRWELASAEQAALAFLAAELGLFATAERLARELGEEGLLTWLQREKEARTLLEAAREAARRSAWEEVAAHCRTLRAHYRDTFAFARASDGTTPLAVEER